jgi:hypothetical protein
MKLAAPYRHDDVGPHPVYPCRITETRHCPAIYAGVCGDDRPCARQESDSGMVWLPEILDLSHGLCALRLHHQPHAVPDIRLWCVGKRSSDL